MRTSFEQSNLNTYGMPPLSDLKSLRSGFDHNEPVYSLQNRAPLLFYKLFLPCVGSIKTCDKEVHQKLLREVYSVSQEGYVLLELANNYIVWMKNALKRYKHDEDIQRDEPEEHQSKEGDETSSLNNSQDERTRKGLSRGTQWTRSRYYTTMDGWSEDGMKSYNEYCLSAKNDRKTKNGIDFETSFLKQMKKDKELLHSRKNKSDMFVEPYNDLCDDSGSDEENNND